MGFVKIVDLCMHRTRACSPGGEFGEAFGIAVEPRHKLRFGAGLHVDDGIAAYHFGYFELHAAIFA